jgi:16S rRNA (cytosine1402-N4)-methyltransferase
MDLGVSSPQIDNEKRGFSFMKNGPLDMRMNQNQELDANYVVNNYDESNLIHIFKEYGEEKFARKIAKNICIERTKNKIKTTDELSEIVKKSIPYKGQKKHPATKVFQAIRIEVNQELSELSGALPKLFDALKSNGRLAILTFHSLEDRIVKNYFKSLVTPPKDIIPKNIPIKDENIDKTIYAENICSLAADKDEILSNPRSRSARLRIIEKYDKN